MGQPIPPFPNARGRVAALTRSRTADDPQLVDARLDMRAARLAEHVAAAVAAMPPFTAEQRAQLAALLAPPIGGGVR